MSIINFRIIIKNFFIYIGLIIAFATLHEIAHGVTAIISGGEWQGIWLTSYVGWGRKSSNVQDYNFYTYTTYSGILSYRCVKIAGSLVALICALLLNQIAVKKQNTTAFSASWTIITEELLYWTISPLLKFGDAYQLLLSFEKMNQITIFTFCLIFFLLLIFSIFVFYKRLLKIVDDIYNINENIAEKLLSTNLSERNEFLKESAAILNIDILNTTLIGIHQIELNRRLAVEFITSIKA